MFFTGETQVQNRFHMEYAVAAVAFTKIGFSAVGIIKARNMHNPLISLFKTISFLDAMVSMVLTQCTLLTMMKYTAAVSSSALFGMGVSALFLITGIFMLVRKKQIPVQQPSPETEEPEMKIIKKITLWSSLRDRVAKNAKP
jgi:predicted membrane protein